MQSPKISAGDLTGLIGQIITSKGEISFREFMALALYHPVGGYYTTRQGIIGWEGDFYTSPDVHPLFGISIMKQLAEMHRLLDGVKKLTVIEPGAGKGILALQILETARKRDPALFEATEYVIVEKSPKMRNLQKMAVEGASLQTKVSWSDDILATLKSAECAIVISNEFLDALPVHRVRYEKEGWKEVFVTAGEGCFQEETAPLSSPRLSRFLSHLEGPFEAGYTTEINLDGLDWITAVGGALHRGFVITIDYGYPRHDYYSPLRTDGTLLCYSRHSTNEEPYLRVGKQDITAHVDFSSLKEAGEAAGLELTGYCDQFHFLMGLGVVEELEELEKGEKDPLDLYNQKEAVKNLLMPDSMGSTFKVLIQHKGLSEPRLRAFSFKNLSHRL